MVRIPAAHPGTKRHKLVPSTAMPLPCAGLYRMYQDKSPMLELPIVEVGVLVQDARYRGAFISGIDFAHLRSHAAFCVLHLTLIFALHTGSASQERRHAEDSKAAQTYETHRRMKFQLLRKQSGG